MNFWNDFAQKHPGAAKWIREGGLFVIVPKSVSDDMLEQLESAPEAAFPTECVRAYEENGGTPWLDYKHTVFGQVFEGMDTVDAIAGVKVDFFQNKPTTDVVMESVEIITV